MTTKKEFEEALNEALDTDIEWSRLKKEDLMEVATLFSHPEVLFDQLEYKSEADKPVNKLLSLGEKWYEGSPGPVASTLRELLGDSEDE